MKNNRMTILGLGAVFAVLLAFVVYFYVQKQSSSTSESLQIASILALTGPAGQIGSEVQVGQQLATDYWKSNGVSVKLHYQDCKGLPKEGLTAFQSARLLGYKLIIAHTSGVSLAIKAQSDPSKELIVALGSHPGITSPPKKGVYLYSQTVSGEVSALNNWLKNKQEFSSLPIVVIHPENDYGKAFADIAKEKIGTTHNIISASYRSDDLPEIRTFLVANLPEGSYVPIVVGGGKGMEQIITAIRERDYNGVILANIGYALTGVKRNLGTDAGKIVYMTLHVDEGKHVEWATAEYKRQYKKNITPEAIIGFNSVSLLVKAKMMAGSDDIHEITTTLPAIAKEVVGSPIDGNDIPVQLVIHEQI